LNPPLLFLGCCFGVTHCARVGYKTVDDCSPTSLLYELLADGPGLPSFWKLSLRSSPLLRPAPLLFLSPSGRCLATVRIKLFFLLICICAMIFSSFFNHLPRLHFKDLPPLLFPRLFQKFSAHAHPSGANDAVFQFFLPSTPLLLFHPKGRLSPL